jgi:hypothetical protein
MNVESFNKEHCESRRPQPCHFVALKIDKVRFSIGGQ